MKKEEFYFDSRDNHSKIHAVKWIPENKPVCIVQIVHGMAEYVERYEEFAKFLVQKDILVTGEDHLGHGKSIGDNPPGYFCKRDAATVVVRDVHRLKKMIQEEYPGIPYFIFGHSMGSIVSRNYIARYGTGIDGVILSGTGNPDPKMLHAAAVMSAVLKCFQGAKHPSKLLDRIGFGHNNDRIEKPCAEHAWLSTNEENVKAYDADPLCGFLFTINGLETVKTLSLRMYDEGMLANIPRKLPVLFIYGAGDPVGEYGKGVKQAYESYHEMGMQDVSIKEYKNDRHELLNEDDKEEVMNDVLKWLMEHMEP